MTVNTLLKEKLESVVKYLSDQPKNIWIRSEHPAIEYQATISGIKFIIYSSVLTIEDTSGKEVFSSDKVSKLYEEITNYNLREKEIKQIVFLTDIKLKLNL